MKNFVKTAAFFLLSVSIFSACGTRVEDSQPSVSNISVSESEKNPATAQNTQPEIIQTPQVPNLQAEILDSKNSASASPIGRVDFKNFTYELPRGWKNQEGKITLENGKAPVSLSEEERRIGATYITTKFADANADGNDEAFVIIKLETGGSAIPQVVYVYEWKNEKPELLWYFRTGDRADGGLKNIFVDNGTLFVEIFGQDRYIVGEVETAKITGDEEQLCCPTHFTRSAYKWNGSDFRMQGKRLTFLINDPNAPPQENLIEIIEKENGAKK